MIAVQTAVACENQALLASERERAALEAQLDEARHTLRERGDELREVLAGQESQRRELAYRLHKEVAQVLPAIVLGLGALERDLDAEPAVPRLDSLRSHVEATLADLRTLAVSLRPPVLDLGLDVALRRLGEQASDRGLERMEVAVVAGCRTLSRETATMVYRLVEETLEAFEAPRSAAVRALAGELRVGLRARWRSPARGPAGHDRGACRTARRQARERRRRAAGAHPGGRLRPPRRPRTRSAFWPRSGWTPSPRTRGSTPPRCGRG